MRFARPGGTWIISSHEHGNRIPHRCAIALLSSGGVRYNRGVMDDRERIRQIARIEVREYIRQWQAQDAEEWEYFIPIAQLSTPAAADLTDADLAKVYSFIAGDLKAWVVEGSPHLDWKNEREFADKFCKAWNDGAALP